VVTITFLGAMLHEHELGRSYEASFFFSSRRRHTRCYRDWSSDVCSSDLSAARLRSALDGVVQVPLRGHGQVGQAAARRQRGRDQIGRASCRERVESPVVAVAVGRAQGGPAREWGGGTREWVEDGPGGGRA